MLCSYVHINLFIKFSSLCGIENHKKEIYITNYLRKGSLTTKIVESTRCSAHTACFLLQELILPPAPNMTKSMVFHG